MPIIHVEIIEGRTVEQKRALGEAITKSTVDILGVPASSIKIVFSDMKKENFMEAGVLRADQT